MWPNIFPKLSKKMSNIFVVLCKTHGVIVVVIVDDGAWSEYVFETVHVWLVITLLPP